MVAYFKKQTWLFMIGGLALGLLVTAVLWNTYLADSALFLKLTYVLMLSLLGVVAGRILAAKWCSKRLQELGDLLYANCDPDAFIQAFEPIVRRVPEDNVVLADGCVKLSFAYEAKGDFEKALSYLDKPDLDKLKLHRLQADSILTNQRMRVQLLMEDTSGAAASLRNLRQLEADAGQRAKMLAEQIHAVAELGQRWLNYLAHGETDTHYISEEAELSKNDIYRAEMELLCGRMHFSDGEDKLAAVEYKNAVKHGRGLWPGKKAAELLEQLHVDL